MAFFGVLEIALHVAKFENIELYRFGSYSIRFRMYKRCHSEIVPVVPYMIKSKDDSRSPAWIDDVNLSFFTREILVYKAHQIIIVNDMCQFRIEIPATPSVLERTNLFLECDLFYTLKDKDNNIKSYNISSKLIMLNNMATGFRHNFDLIFGDYQASVVHLNINSVVLHYRIRDSLKNIASPAYEPGRCFKKWEMIISDCNQRALARWFSQPSPSGQNFYNTFDKEYNADSIYTTEQLLESFINYLCLDIKLSEMACRRIFSINTNKDGCFIDKDLLLEYERNYYTCKDFTCFTLRISFMDKGDKVKCCPATKNVVKDDENCGLVYANNLMFSYILYAKILGEALSMLNTFSYLPSGTYVHFENGKICTIPSDSIYLSSETTMFNNDSLGCVKDMIYKVLEEGMVSYAACGSGQVVVIPMKTNGIKLVIPSIDLLALNNDLDALCNEIERNLWNISSFLFIKWNEFLDNELNRTYFERYRIDERFFITLASEQMDHLDLEGLIQSLPVVDDCHIYALSAYPLFRIHPIGSLKGIENTAVKTDSLSTEGTSTSDSIPRTNSTSKSDEFVDSDVNSHISSSISSNSRSSSFANIAGRASANVNNNGSFGNPILHATIKKVRKNFHLFVLVHGYNASARSMEIIKSMITIIFPDSVCLSSCFNQGLMNDSISEMGEKLSTEVKMYIKYCMPASKISKITFVAHSLGGLIVRSALSDLNDYSHMFHGFISLASAHIGYYYNLSKFVDIGIWFLRKVKNSRCITELALSDASEITETFVYRLSCVKDMEWFKYVVLVSSDLDQYAPFYSARIDTGRIPISGVRHVEMAYNILNSIKCLIRIDCNLSQPLKYVKGWIGKTAHLEFVESVELIRAMLYTLKNENKQ